MKLLVVFCTIHIKYLNLVKLTQILYPSQTNESIVHAYVPHKNVRDLQILTKSSRHFMHMEPSGDYCM